mmetsp:Transcript_3580/g.7771  ORF Transcript_3580/g.7771 Transcript_3580/m.7771 type:complete len:145 (-) Transcript_3580:1358-1792(-)
MMHDHQIHYHHMLGPMLSHAVRSPFHAVRSLSHAVHSPSHAVHSLSHTNHTPLMYTGTQQSARAASHVGSLQQPRWSSELFPQVCHLLLQSCAIFANHGAPKIQHNHLGLLGLLVACYPVAGSLGTATADGIGSGTAADGTTGA